MKTFLVSAWQVLTSAFTRHITAFRLLYWGTAIATFRHSALGFTTVEGRLFWGALSALAVDIAMLLAAEKLRETRSHWLIAGLAVACCASVYSQSLFTVTHSAAVEIAAGALWMQEIAQWIIDLRVIVIPILLPAQVVIFALASNPGVEETEAKSKKQLCEILRKLVPSAGPTQVAEAASALSGEKVSVATASRAK